VENSASVSRVLSLCNICLTGACHLSKL